MLGSHGQPENRSWKRVACSRGSPEAVGRKQIFGTGRPDSSSANRSRATVASIVNPPPPIARILRRSSGTNESLRRQRGGQCHRLTEVPDREVLLGHGAVGGDVGVTGLRDRT